MCIILRNLYKSRYDEIMLFSTHKNIHRSVLLLAYVQGLIKHRESREIEKCSIYANFGETANIHFRKLIQISRHNTNTNFVETRISLWNLSIIIIICLTQSERRK